MLVLWWALQSVEVFFKCTFLTSILLLKNALKVSQFTSALESYDSSTKVCQERNNFKEQQTNQQIWHGACRIE